MNLGRGGDIHWLSLEPTATTRELGVEWIVFPVNTDLPLFRSRENPGILFRCVQGVRLVLEET